MTKIAKPPGPSAICGSLTGLMLGDALGLPYEGLQPSRIRKLTKNGFRHKMLFGKGMVSDDSEHAAITASALIRTLPNANNVGDFEKNLAWRLRWWFLRLPAGIGLATAKSIIKLWIGFPTSKSGVYSAGNGPAMRAPILGIYAGHDKNLLRKLIKSSTNLTHTDPKAYYGALAIAAAAYYQNTPQLKQTHTYFEYLSSLIPKHDNGAQELLQYLSIVQSALSNDDNESKLVEQLGLQHGVTGYINHTVPIVLFVYLKYGKDFAKAIESTIKLGGDTDTTAAILGGILGADATLETPREWLVNIVDWPINPKSMNALGLQLEDAIKNNTRGQPPTLCGPLILLRNLIFLIIVLGHGFRRLLPPYN